MITELVCTLYSDWRHVSVDFIQPRSNRNLVFFIFFSSPITVEPNARKVKMFVIRAARRDVSVYGLTVHLFSESRPVVCCAFTSSSIEVNQITREQNNTDTVLTPCALLWRVLSKLFVEIRRC